MIAAASGSKRTLDKVLAQGARVDLANELGYTAMHFAAKASGDSSDIIRELHARGLAADVQAKGKWIEAVHCGDGLTPLHLVQHAGSAATLIELGGDSEAFGVSPFGSDYGTAVFMAAANGKATVLKAMLDGGVTVSGSYCWWAAKLGKIDCVKTLLCVCARRGRTGGQAARLTAPLPSVLSPPPPMQQAWPLRPGLRQGGQDDRAGGVERRPLQQATAQAPAGDCEPAARARRARRDAGQRAGARLRLHVPRLRAAGRRGGAAGGQCVGKAKKSSKARIEEDW
jgi:hypothetical protein